MNVEFLKNQLQVLNFIVGGIKIMLEESKIDEDSILHQVLSCRSTVDAILVNLSGPEGGKCKHPEDRRLNLTTMGMNGKKWMCKDCGEEFIEEGDD